MDFETILQHLGEEEHDRGAATPPIYQTSTYVYDSVEAFLRQGDPLTRDDGRPVYSRVSHPTAVILEKKLAALEETDGALVFASGMSAITAAIMVCVSAGSHVVAVDTCYGPTRTFLESYLPRFGVTTTFVTGVSTEEIEAAMRPETAMVYLESPSSLLFRFQDLRAVSAICRERGILTVIDNSYATPLYQKPATMGIDLVCHTATKFLGGHSDVVAGAVCGRGDLIAKMATGERELLGHILAPFPAWLMLRGMRTLGVRMRQSEETGHRLAGYLKGHPMVDEVIHAGAEWHPQRALFESQMSGSCSLVTFLPKVQDEAKITRFLNSLEHFQMGVSWGGFESLAVANKTQPMDWPEPRWFVRLYGGLESVEDLVADLDRSFRLAFGD